LRRPLDQGIGRSWEIVTLSGPLRSHRVLIVEDNPHIFEMYAYVLKKLGQNAQGKTASIEVHCAANGHEGWLLLAKLDFDLVLTDLYMPVLDGFQLVERIRKTPTTAAVPVVVITAGGEDAIRGATERGATRVLKKPVRFTEVMEIVLTHLKIE
jgi:CheY-like chemotaxis protein